MKIKAVIFDLDGVLVSSREMHYISLNKALEQIAPQCVIPWEEHLAQYDGLPTTIKLQKLTDDKQLDSSLHNDIWKLKQEFTVAAINEVYKIDDKIVDIFTQLRKSGYKVCVASNSIREVVRMILFKLGVLHLTDYYYSNEDVHLTKPNSEIYLRCILDCKVDTQEVLIIEDSHHGRMAAIGSGAHLLAVRNPNDVTLDTILDKIDALENKPRTKPKWQGGQMNVLIPMAGAGSRFAAAGYTFPKPLIDVKGKPMIQLVVENLNIDAKHIFIVQREHYEKYNLNTLLNIISPKCEIIQIDGVTEGAACTTLLAKEFINNDEPLLMANSDQWIEWDSNQFMYSMTADHIDGGVLTFGPVVHPKWSFAKLDSTGYIVEIAEKNPISNIGTVGLYFWSRGKDYVKYAEQMIAADKRVNNEFYVAPVYNEAIRDGARIKPFNIKRMYGLGTPEDLQTFLNDVDKKEITL